MSRHLSRVLNRQSLLQMGGPPTFARGEAYFVGGQVLNLELRGGIVRTVVSGTREYLSRLWEESDTLGYDCTCPVFADGSFCKHCVAIGLAWLASGEEEQTPASSNSKRSQATLKDVEAYLKKQDAGTLIALILEQAQANERLREKLLLRAARNTLKKPDLAVFRCAIDRATRADFVHYREARGYAEGILEALGPVRDLLNEGFATEAIELAEYALRAAERAMESVDDSDGHMGGVLEEVQELHLEACEEAKPDVAALAGKLFQWELHSPWETFLGASSRYEKVLGELGLAVYRELAEAEWSKVPQLRPGERDQETYGKRFRITHIMETLARQSGDIEALVTVESRNLSYAYSFLKIAEIYRQTGNNDKALEWAERGVKAFPKDTDNRFLDFLAEEYHRRHRHDEAMALVWRQFEQSPVLEQYQKLKSHADRVKTWPLWREKAMLRVRDTLEDATKAKPATGWAWNRAPDHSALVRIFVWEDDIESAWNEATSGGCSNDLWMVLAGKREQSHPEESVVVYQTQIEPILDQKNNGAYSEGVRLLKKVSTLLRKLGREGEFVHYLTAVRNAHKPKRNFIKLLDSARF